MNELIDMNEVFQVFKISYVGNVTLLKLTEFDYRKDLFIDKQVYDKVSQLKNDLLFLKKFFSETIRCTNKDTVLKEIDGFLNRYDILLKKYPNYQKVI